MTKNPFYQTIAAAAGVALALLAGAGSTQARDGGRWRRLTRVSVGVSNGYVHFLRIMAPAPVFMAPRPIYYAPTSTPGCVLRATRTGITHRPLAITTVKGTATTGTTDTVTGAD